MVACGGWSFRRTLYGGDQFDGRDDDVLDPTEGEAAKIRAVFVHPWYVRRGLGRWLVEECEGRARERGFVVVEMGATLSGVEFYRGMGYEAVDDGREGREEKRMEGGEFLAVVRMGKVLM